MVSMETNNRIRTELTTRRCMIKWIIVVIVVINHVDDWWLMIDNCWRNVLYLTTDDWLSFVSRVVVDVIFRQFFSRSTCCIVSSQTYMHTYEWPVFIYAYKLYAVYDMYEYVHDSKLGWWQKAQKKHLTMRIRWSDVQGIGFSLSMHLNLWWFPRFSVPRFPVRTDPLNVESLHCHTVILAYCHTVMYSEYRTNRVDTVLVLVLRTKLRLHYKFRQWTVDSIISSSYIQYK